MTDEYSQGPAAPAFTRLSSAADLRPNNATDEAYQAKVDKWRKPFDKFARKVIGRTTYDLDQSRCKDGECACALNR